MAGFTTAFSRTTLNAAIENGDKIQWSTDGTNETAHVDATTITTWKAASDADPAVRDNDGAYLSAACADDAVEVTHFRVVDSAETTIKTDWTALSSSRTLDTGDKLSIADGEINVTLT